MSRSTTPDNGSAAWTGSCLLSGIKQSDLLLDCGDSSPLCLNWRCGRMCADPHCQAALLWFRKRPIVQSGDESPHSKFGSVAMMLRAMAEDRGSGAAYVVGCFLTGGNRGNRVVLDSLLPPLRPAEICYSLPKWQPPGGTLLFAGAMSKATPSALGLAT